MAVLGASLLTLPFAAETRAELITFQFAGTVTSVTVDPAYQSYDFPDIGDPFAGFYKFDSNTRDGAVGADLGSFTTVLSERVIGVSVGEFQFEGLSVNIGTSQDFYDVGDLIPSIELSSNPALAHILDNNNCS
jgi:hypothetical protein